MANSSDRSENAPPRPELNPLLNPLLADNMGRWAEVYFSSPPERREEAVLELLRELQGHDSTGTMGIAESAHELQPQRPASENAMADMRRCGTCGHENPSLHQFCGMCGAQMFGSAPDQFGTEDAYSPQGVRYEGEPRGVAESDAEYREAIGGEPFAAEEFRRDPYDLSPFQGLRERELEPDFDYEQPPSGRYRYAIGAVLAILMFGLGYLAWRASHANQSAQGSPPPPPPAATDNAPPSANASTAASVPSNPPKTGESAAAPAAKRTALPATPKPAEEPKPVDLGENSRPKPPSTTSPAQPEATYTGQQGPQGSGAEEFAMAQRYLTSQPHNSREAAKWLWKAMSKHNGPATVALADLYLKGDGVAKSCDQARVLLDSAATRGVAGAGERIRNLQAFGCQ